MNISLNPEELKEVLHSIRTQAHRWLKSANTAESEGYPLSAEEEMANKAQELYSLADKIETQINRVSLIPRGSSASVDPFENVNINKGAALTPNDPVEW